MEYCIYHSRDLDGFTSGAIVYLNQKRFGEECTLVGYDYGDKLDTRKFKGRLTVMIDVSMPMERMEVLGNAALEFIWIDHHKSAFDDFMAYTKEKGYPVSATPLNSQITMYTANKMNMIYYYSSVLSACEISALIFNRGIEKEQSRIISLLGQYDTWRNTEEKKFASDSDWDDTVMPVQYFMRSCSGPKEVYNMLCRLNSWDERYITLQEMIKTGKYILKYQKNLNDSNIRKFFEFEMDGLNVIAVNTLFLSSQTFEGYYHPEIHDAMMPFHYDGKKKMWTFSLYTTKDDVDILSVAKNMNGGGHAKACGFQLPMKMVHFEDDKIVFGIREVENSSHIENAPEVTKPITPELFMEKPSKKGHVYRAVFSREYLIPNVFIKKFDTESESLEKDDFESKYEKYIVQS